VSTVGLLLRPDAYLAESSDGAYLLTHEGSVVFTGRSVHQLIERLAPYLDGRHTLAELTADLADDRADAVRKLVGMLVDRGVVREVDRAEPAPARPETRYLGYFHDAPARRFEQYQDTATVVLGDGPVAAALARAATRSGLRDVRASAAVLDGADLVLHVSTEFEDAERLERRSAGRLAQVVLRGEHAWLGLTGPGTRLWGSVRRRSQARPDEPGGPTPGGAAVTVLANRLVHAAFRVVTGLDEPWTDRVVRIDLSTLAEESHRVVPHPLAGPAAEPTRIEMRRQSLDQETFSRQAVACADDRIGLFGEPTERDLAQIPLRVCEISVPDPAGLLGPGAPAPVVTGAGLDFPTARYRAALRAFACYGSLMVDPRRPRDGFVTGYDLVSLDPVLVAATLAFPALDGSTVLPVGAAAGYSWPEAIEAGLAEHCRRLTIAELSTPRARVDLPGTELDAAGDRYRDMLAAIGQPVTVYDITGSTGVPTFLSYLDGEPAGCASRLAAADALTDTLEQTVLHYQARKEGQADYAPPSAPELPGRLDAPVAPPPPSVDLAAAVAVLRAHGHRPVAVPLDHDPEATRIMPYTVQVVLLDD
jgi:hypothetical protein